MQIGKCMRLRIAFGLLLMFSQIPTIGRAQENSASTAFQGYTQGIADIISASGQAAIATSQANVNNQSAISMRTDNRMQWTNTYFEMRRINADARAAELGPRLTTEDWIRMSKMMAPKRLNSVALDPISGHITWPPALTVEVFASYRRSIEAFFANRALTGTVANYRNLLQLEAAADSLTEELKKHIHEFPTKDYLLARNFVESLSYEARFAAN